MKPILALAFSATCWGLNFHLLKIMLTRADFVEAGFWRFLFAIAALLFFCRRSLSSVYKTKGLTGIIAVGFFLLFGFNALLFYGLKYTSPVNASLIISLTPVFTLLFTRFLLHTALELYQVAGAVFSIAGVAYLLSGGQITELSNFDLSEGDLMVLAATLLSALYHVSVQKYSLSVPNRVLTLITNFVCLLTFALLLPFGERFDPASYGTGFWIAAFTFGVLGTAVTFILWNYGIFNLGAGKAGIFINITPIITAVIGWVAGDPLTNVHVISGTLILAGITISRMRPKPNFFSRINNRNSTQKTQ